jgi:hypothetical protein
MFPVTRLYSDSNGDTRFEGISIPLTDAGEIGKLSEGIPVKSIIFREVEASYDYNFHNAPQKQYLILIDGGIEIETSLGEKGNFRQDKFFYWKTPKARGTGPGTSKKERSDYFLPFCWVVLLESISNLFPKMQALVTLIIARRPKQLMNCFIVEINTTIPTYDEGNFCADFTTIATLFTGSFGNLGGNDCHLTGANAI